MTQKVEQKQKKNTASKNILISTQGVKYAGSKLKIIPYICDAINDLNIKSVLDGFSGTTRVSQAFAQMGLDVTSNDIAHWSEVFAKCYLLHDKPLEYYQSIIDELNGLVGFDGWFTENYGGDEEMTTKMPFQKKNTRKLDAIRKRVDEMALDDTDKAVILTSLCLGLDAVDSTIGHFVSYLSKWSSRSYNDLTLKVPQLIKTSGKHRVCRGDIFDLLDEDIVYDLAYFDPPYGSNNEKMPPSRVRYASYYHIWTSVVRNDRPQLFGKVNRREDSRDLIAGSEFEEYKKNENGHYIAMEAIRRMIEKTKAKYILLSYSSGGRATKEELKSIIEKCGKLEKVVEIDYKKNIMATMRWTNEWLNSDEPNKEFLFLMSKPEYLITPTK